MTQARFGGEKLVRSRLQGKRANEIKGLKFDYINGIF